MSNILKRKNEEVESLSDDQLNKRPALDSEQLDQSEKDEESAQMAPAVQESNEGSSSADIHSPKEPSLTAEASQSTETPISIDDSNKSKSQEVNLPDLAFNALVDLDNQNSTSAASKPVHREREDSTTVSLRMYCPVKEAGMIVGKKGETITHLREKANVRIFVSENLKNVPERIVSVRGSAENVARAFGLITRTILEEPEDEPASILSKQFNMKLLIPHPMVGYIIGKLGAKFREIEENSAAKLKAAENPLPYSTDRVLSISGVGDAIHIAVYYISQVILEHKDCLKKQKIVFYNPANYRQQIPTGNPLMNMAMNRHPNAMPYLNGQSPASMPLQGLGAGNALKDSPYGQVQKPYNFQMMFQPSIRPQYPSPAPQQAMAGAPLSIPHQNAFTDEHGNTIVGDVITQVPVQVSASPEKFNEDVFVANTNIGSVIGRGGNNIKQIRESSGCTYVKIEPDQNQTLLLGGGKGVTNVRRLTLTGSYNAIQTAIYLINQRISADKERNGVQ